MQTVRDRLIAIIKEHVKVDDNKLTDDANLVDDLGVDSLTLFELILDMEKEFGCDIPEQDSNRIVSIGSGVTYIEEKIKNGTAK